MVEPFNKHLLSDPMSSSRCFRVQQNAPGVHLKQTLALGAMPRSPRSAPRSTHCCRPQFNLSISWASDSPKLEGYLTHLLLFTDVSSSGRGIGRIINSTAAAGRSWPPQMCHGDSRGPCRRATDITLSCRQDFQWSWAWTWQGLR